MRRPGTNAWSTGARPPAAPAAAALRCGLLLALALAAGCAGTGSGPRFDPLAISPEQARDDAPAFAAAVAAAVAQRDADPAAPYWPYRLGALYAAADSAAGAELHLHEALRRDPDYAPAVCLLSELQYRRGDHGAAADLLGDHLARHPAAPAALRAALALNLAALGEPARAQAVLDDAGKDGAGRDAVLAGVGAYLRLAGDGFLDALEPARLAVAADPGSAAAHNNLGIALLYAGRPHEAHDAFTAALARDPRLPGAMYNLAIVEATYFFDPDAGRAWFERYRRLGGPDPDDLASLLGAEPAPAAPAAATVAAGGAR